MKKKILCMLFSVLILFPSANAEIIPYYDFNSDNEVTIMSMHVVDPYQGGGTTDATEETAAVEGDATEVIDEMEIPKAAPPAPAYPQVTLDALEKAGINPYDVIDLNAWWDEAEDGETCPVDIGDCIAVSGFFYKVIAKAPPFEKNPGMKAYDLTTLVTMMPNLFTRIYPPLTNK